MNDLYEALEICLRELEQGADVETVLSRYPGLADELRPILEGSFHARSMAVAAPAPEAVRRSRAKVLQHAAHMREAKAQSSQRMWFASLRRVVVTIAVVAALFMSGTGLVRAASTTLPGDNLYPVKRTWEDVLLLFTFNLQDRAALAIEHENERLYELEELFAEGRSAEVDFSGRVIEQSENELIVNGVRVVISTQTEVRDGPISVGSAVRVRGWTQGNDTVLAERIRLLSSDDQLPDVEHELEIENENDNQGSGNSNEDNSGPGSGSEDPTIAETPDLEPRPREETFEGVVSSIDNNILVVNGITLDISVAEEIRGIPAIGVPVKVEGYYDSNGIFIVIRIEFENDGSGSGNNNTIEDDSSNSGSDSTNDNGDSDDNSGSGSGNDNGGDDNGGNDNGDDSGGGSDNSGPGGGGDDNSGGGD